jgi:hypothetical protein
MGHRPRAPLAYKLGVRSRWLLGDLDHMLLRLFRTDRALQLPASAPSRLRALVEFARSALDGSRDGVRSGEDPRPFVHELREYTRALVRSVGR